MTLVQAVSSLIERFPVRHLNPSDPDAADRYLRSYIEDLEDFPEPLVVAAIERLRRTATFMPQVSEIRSLVVEAVCGLPTESQAWQQVRQAMTQPVNSGPWDVHPLVLSAVREVGTWELRNDDNGKAADRFRKVYREKRTELVHNMQAGIVPLPQIGPGHDAVLGLKALAD